MELFVCLGLLALCPCEIWALLRAGVRKCTHLVHRATILLWVLTVVAFCAALIGVGAEAEITVSVLAGVQRYTHVGTWPGSGLVIRCLGPGFTVEYWVCSLL